MIGDAELLEVIFLAGVIGAVHVPACPAALEQPGVCEAEHVSQMDDVIFRAGTTKRPGGVRHPFGLPRLAAAEGS